MGCMWCEKCVNRYKIVMHITRNFSQSLEESPVSDNKMDISETTTSQDSPPGYSPEADDCNEGYKQSHRGSDITIAPTALSANDNCCGSSTTYEQQEILTKYLDNRNDDPINVDMLCSKTGNRTTNSGLTPVSSHPLMLMSPTGSESDSSELINANKNQNGLRNYYQFPDVVPVSEQPPLRLASPYPNRTETATRTGTTSKTTTATRSTTSTLDVINNIDNANTVKKTSLLQDASPVSRSLNIKI